MSKRLISHTEVSTAFDCQAKHSFAYTGHLTGGTVLTPKQDALKLREGRAWGRAAAALHMTLGSPLDRLTGALTALTDALEQDAAKLREHGLYVESEHHDLQIRLMGLLEHYATTTDPLDVFSPELELHVPLPSRTGKGPSSKFVFHGYLDALTRSYPGHEGRLFIVEYKLRDRLTDPVFFSRDRQIRRYAWAAERQLDEQVAGVIVDERLNEVPKPARWVKSRKKDEGLVPSHAKEQLTTAELYEQACLQAGVAVEPETFAALGSRRWQQRHVVIFRRGEIAEAGAELVSAGQLIAQLDSGVLFPVRNTSPQRCNGCRFNGICADVDPSVISLDFVRRLPKRLRTPEEELAIP